MGRRALIGAAVIAVVAMAGVLTISRRFRGPTAEAILHERMTALRAETDSCVARVDEQQAALLAYRARTDSMHQRVRSLEELDSRGARGVPQDSFVVYMAAFNEYNTAAAAWDARVDSLQTALAACRAVATEHNAVVDSLRVQRALRN